MSEILKGKIQVAKGLTFIISGVDRWGFRKNIRISPDHQMTTFSIRDYCFKFQIDHETYVMNFKDLDLSKPVIPTRLIPELARQKERHILLALYDLVAEVSLYHHGLVEKLELEPLVARYGDAYGGVSLESAVIYIEKSIPNKG